MVDFILFVFMLVLAGAAAYAGMMVGRTYQTLGAAFAAARAWFKAKL